MQNTRGTDREILETPNAIKDRNNKNTKVNFYNATQQAVRKLYPTIRYGHFLHMPHLFLGEAEEADNCVRERAEFVLHLSIHSQHKQ